MAKPFRLLPAVLWAALIWRLTTTPNLVVTPESWLNNLIMSGSHFFFFGVLALLLRFALYAIRHTSYSEIVPVVVTSLYGALIEYAQLSVPGRSADPVDWLLDTAGALVFLGIMNKFLNLKS